MGTNIKFLLGGIILLPWMAWMLLRTGKPFPDNMKTPLILVLLSVLLSGAGHAFLSLLPVFDRFRFPFKMFFFAGLFLTPLFFLMLERLHSQKILQKGSVAIAGFALLSHFLLFLSPPPFSNGHWLTTTQSPLPAFTREENNRSVTVLSRDRSGLWNGHALLPFANFSTLWQVPGITGYKEALLSTTNGDIAAQAGFTTPLKTSSLPAIMDHLSSWSVRYVFTDVPIDPSILRETSLTLMEAGSAMPVYENPGAFPVASFESAPHDPIPIEYFTNRVRLHTRGKTGAVRLRLAPIAGYSSADSGGVMRPVTLTQSGLLLQVSSPRDSIDVVYRSRAFETGIIGSLVGCITILAGFVFIRKRHVQGTFFA